ncbi:hypothetical protein BS17DRAFT_807138 [Gyrodon lividus]|nr:hypothetical protein BS17DRAFT_807138 [Gyrodon lividus]
MTKGQKSSASSGTRKKNARKAAQATHASSSTAPPPSPVPKPLKTKNGKNGKLSKREAKEQRKKVYIPPTKPAPPVLDPLDTTGLAHLLPPHLVVVLRALGKKDVVTRGKAIEELARWVDEAIKEEAVQDRDRDPYEEEMYGEKSNVVVKMLPVWLHRAPVLFTHPARRLRHLSASLQLSILRLTPARESFIAWANDIASQDELETVLGTWAMLAHDTDRGVAGIGIKSWAEVVSTTPNLGSDTQSQPCDGSISQLQHVQSQLKFILAPRIIISLFTFAHRTVLDPQGLHMYLNPGPVATPAVHEHPTQGKKGAPQEKGGAQGKKVAPTPPQSQQKKSGRYVPPTSESKSPSPSLQSDRGTGDSASEENDSDRAGRLRVGALGLVQWILENCLSFDSAAAAASPVVTTITVFLSSPAFWSTLHPGTALQEARLGSNETHQTCPFAAVSFGQNQPQVRQAAWALIGCLVRRAQGPLPEPLSRMLSTAVLRSAWIETEVAVRAALGVPLLLFLRNYPHAWAVDADSAIGGYKNLEDAGIKNKEGDDSDSDSESDLESGSGSGSDGGSDDGKEFADAQDAPADLLHSQKLRKPPQSSQAYTEFLQFLELGCSGSPVEGYAMVLVVIAGIPESIFPASFPPRSLARGAKMDDMSSEVHPITRFLTSFWAPLDAHLLDRRAAASAWLKALSECLLFIIRRGTETHEVTTQPMEDAKTLLTSQFSRLWIELVTKRLRIEEIEAAGIVVGALGRVGKLGEDLFNASFDALFPSIPNPVHTSDSTLDLAPSFLHVFITTFAPDTHAGQKTRGAVEAYTQRIVETLEFDLRTSDQTSTENTVTGPLTTLIKVMDTFGPSLFNDAPFAARTDALFLAHPVELLKASAQGVLAYLRHRSGSSCQAGGELQTQTFWTELLGAIASCPRNTALSLLSPLLDASLPTHIRGMSETMDELMDRWVGDVIATGAPAANETTVAKVLSCPAPFLSSAGLAAIASALSNSIADFAEARIRIAGVPSAQLGDLEGLVEAGPILGLMRKLVGSGYEFIGDGGVGIYAGVFLLAFVIPCDGEEDGGYPEKVVEDAKALWSSWAFKDSGREHGMREVVGALVKQRLKMVVIDDKVETRPEHIIRSISPSPAGIYIDVLADILPSRAEYDAMLDSGALPSSSISPSLALLDPTLPTCSSSPTPSNSTHTAYTRATSALLAHLSTSRSVARSNLWALRHVLTLGFYANEYLRVEGVRSGIFTVGGGKEDIKDVVEKVKSLTTYLLGRIDEDVHAKAVSTLMGKKAGVIGDDGSLASFVIEVAQHAREKDRVRDTAVLGIVLQHLFADATKDDADLWLGLARRLEKTAPQTAITILAAITAYAPEPPKLDRYRNELAASLLGVRPSAAPTTGLTIIRLLVATAPDPESDVVFLPQQRAVNVIKVCQTWVAAEDDEEDGDDGDGVNEDVESAMTLVFFHLAPILQNVPGSHWELIWDVVENNLENCSLEDSATLTTLGRTIKLLMAIEDLASTNKPLRANWEEKKSPILALIRDIVAVDTRAIPYSEPRALCRELALSVVQDIPSTMMTERTLPNMCHLLVDQSQEVQRMGHHLLQNAARKRTEHYVIESAVDTEDVVKPKLPTELLAILQQSLNSGEALDLDDQLTTRNMDVSGYLLAWMITFDLFIGASLKVRSDYFNHMRSLDIISQHFIPNIFDILGLFSGGKQVFKLDVWAVDEFYLDTVNPGSSVSLQLLAAHLYHRALLTVPALIRSWISDCTDKQLLTRVVEYTSSYFSPGIIKAELAQVRQPDAAPELTTTENLSVKVSPASGEVTASYTVDDQALELSIRMPSDWPLHRLEVRDTKMVGVSEDKWRAWVLGVQQVVWQQVTLTHWSERYHDSLVFPSKNGRIVDGLTLFTKNVTLHFAGQVECAICYSIISVMDASLPQKPCKTCKNRFHASCLYKWFKTSHSSSCPLCRSDIL